VPIKPRPELPNVGAVDWIYKSPGEVFDAVNALPEKPVLIVNHPSQGDFQSYFSSALFDRSTAKGSPELWSENFGAIEVFNTSDFEDNRTSSVADWFALLNAGKNFAAVGNSDSHRVRSSPVGYPRNCMKFGHDDPTKLTAETVRDVLRTGSSTVSGGLMIDVTGPGGVGPGGTGQAGSYQVTVLSPSWIEASTLEVIVDGDTVKKVDLVAQPAGAGPGKKYTATVDVQGSSSRAKHWVLFHASGPAGKDLAPLHPGRRPFAVSNPIWF
jgi:hypothetical protein